VRQSLPMPNSDDSTIATIALSFEFIFPQMSASRRYA
jgi:hypothetical protein